MSKVTDLLWIRHRTVYKYAVPVTFHPHRLVLRPREGHDLRVERMDLTIKPACTVRWSRDVFGNSIAWAEFSKPSKILSFSSEVLVRHSGIDRKTVFSPEANLYPPQYDSLELPAMAPYLTPIYPGENALIREWLRGSGISLVSTTAEKLIHDLNRLIKKSISYKRRDEKGVQPPSVTLTGLSGSCRDLATLMMEAARHLGFGARFASGYLDCNATRAARGSTHAWTEIYFPELGWRGFDPTIGEPVTHQHIVTGVSHHPRGVMPISGTYSGRSKDARGLTVVVEFASGSEADASLGKSSGR